MKILGCAAAFGVLAWALLHHATQGMHEDAIYVAAFSSARPIVWQARGVSQWTLWMQIHHGVTPVAVRAWNLAGALGVAGLAGLLASRLGLSGWIASAVMLMHPLTIETLTTMSGRYELIAATGVLVACVGATVSHPVLRWGLIGLGFTLGWLGKQTAIVGVPLAALVWWTQERTPIAAGIFAVTIIGLLAVTWHARYAGTLDLGSIAYRSPIGSWALLQATAAWRLIVLAIVPVGQTPDYDYDRVRMGWRVVAGVGLIGTGVLAWSLWPTARLFATGMAWMLIVCLPRLIVQTPKSYFNEHQFYLALVGLALIVAASYRELEWRWCGTA